MLTSVISASIYVTDGDQLYEGLNEFMVLLSAATKWPEQEETIL